MDIRRSSLHEAIGSTAPLDHNLIIEAVSEGVAEDERLDWKRSLPTDGDEVAKDVAAMANSRGGLLVYGVAEDRRTGRASAVQAVSLDEAHQKRIRAWLGTRVHPVVPGVVVLPVRESDTDDTGFLVVLVPESSDAPHLTGSPESFKVPYRYGAQTMWMRERDIERAYTERFERRLADESHLTSIIDHLSDDVDLEEGCWMLGVAVPTVPVPGNTQPPDRSATVKVIQAALSLGLDIAAISSARGSVIRSLDNDALNPRVGLRRWIARTSRNQDPSDRSDYVHLEVHHDGGVALAARLNGWYPQPEPAKNYVPIQMVAGFSADLLALAAQGAGRVGPGSQMLVRTTLARADELPFGLLTNRTVRGYTLGELSQPSWTRDVRRFVPVDAMLAGDENVEELKSVASSLYQDVLAEFGYDASEENW